MSGDIDLSNMLRSVPDDRRSQSLVSPLSMTPGIGLRAPHMEDLLEQRPGVGWLEVHSENYFGSGGNAIGKLLRVREDYQVSLHGVGLSIGSNDPLNSAQLEKLQRLINVIDPVLVSEHLSWGSVDGVFFNDLLPLPYTEEALRHYCNKVSQVQDTLDRQILVENPSSYLRYKHSTISEPEFLTAVAERTGAALLLDVNNVYVSARNHNFDPVDYLSDIPGHLIEEIHLAGHTIKRFTGGELYIDDHASPVSDDVWILYAESLAMFGPKPTLIEWDADLPSLDRLVAEADVAGRHLGSSCGFSA